MSDTPTGAASAAPVAERDALTVWADTHATNKLRLEESRNELREAVRRATAAGMTEVEAARLAGVTRMTVRSWLGK